MTTSKEPELLDDRKASILRAIVEEYVQTAQPVGSQTVARSCALGVSSATIRNDMTILEREGYITQPHTSAGRVPTDLGYRYFVDNLITGGGLPVAQRRTVFDFFTSANKALEDLLHETSQLLATMTRHAALVSAPRLATARVRGVHLVLLQPNTVMAVVVLSNGAVEREVIRREDAVDEDLVARATAVLAGELDDASWSSLPPPRTVGQPDVDALVADTVAVLEAARRESTGEVYVGGASRIAAEQEFATVETVGRLLELLEHQLVVVSLVRELTDIGPSVRIGSENTLDQLRECSIVLAPYELDGRRAGLVGVLGPTRMDYRHTLAAVAAVSEQLGRHLS